MSNPMSIEDLVAQNLAPPAEAPAAPVPDEGMPPEPGLEDLMGAEDPEMMDPAPQQGMSEDEMREAARQYLRAQGDIVGSPQEVAEHVRSLGMPPQQMQEEPPVDPMAEIMAMTQGLQPYQGEGDFDEQAAFVAAQVSMRSNEQFRQAILSEVQQTIQAAMQPIVQAAQNVQMNQTENAVREDLRGLNLDDRAVDATIEQMKRMGPGAMQAYLEQDVFREAMQGYGLSKKTSTKAETLAARQGMAPVDPLPAAKDAGGAPANQKPKTIQEMVAMAANDSNYGRN